MDGNAQFFIGVVLALIGILLSWYFFHKSKEKKELKAYLQFHTKIFSGIDPTLRKELIITYKDAPVDNLHQIQLIVANTGNKAISQLLEPLQLIVAEGFDIFEY